MRRTISVRMAATAVLLACACSGARGNWTPYAGFDTTTAASVGSATASLQAEAAWLTAAGALGPIHTVDFESMTVGTTGISHIIAPGVRMVASASFNPHSLTVASGPIGGGYAPINGFNSTQGGQRHMHFISGSGSVATNQIVYFLFDQPVSAFSTFITGHGEGDGFIGPGMTTITAQPAAGGLSSTVFVNDWHTHNPNVRFAGFTDSAKGFNRATVQLRTYSSEYEWRGSFSFDDVRWVYAPIPEPGALLLIAGVVPGLSLLRRRL